MKNAAMVAARENTWENSYTNALRKMKLLHPNYNFLVVIRNILTGNLGKREIPNYGI